jgi:uncharacterized protein (DUF983 family)
MRRAASSSGGDAVTGSFSFASNRSDEPAGRVREERHDASASPTPTTPRPRPMTRRPEMDSETGLELPTLGRTLRLFGRGFLMRCPNCGRGPVLQGWLKLRVRCGACGLRLQRGEHDTIMGSVFILFTLVALVCYALIVLALSVTETTPWDLLQNGLPVLALVLVVALLPLSKLLWLAFDLMLRPVTPQELEWHRTSDAEFETERDAAR